MAVIDPRSEAVVIRIAYDGAPLAGKSTSVRALGKGLGASVVTPAEVSGRTLYFDWLDYTGGLFEGRSIRCQIISVPGQASLAPRRRRLLEQADVVVYVGDSTAAGFKADRAYLGGLTRILDKVPGPPVGIVLQANKRDQPDAVPLGQIHEMLDALGLHVGVVESVATEGSGVRAAFVFAVRLALDRVRELMRTGQLKSAAPEVDSADDLLETMRREEGGSLEYALQSGLAHTRLADVQSTSLVAEALSEVVRENQLQPTQPPQPEPLQPPPQAQAAAPAEATRPPATPDGSVPSGFVWPPVDGRMILNELSGARVELTRSERGDWLGSANARWRLLSPADALYDDMEAGRSVLVQSARSQSARMQGRVFDRCVVLAPDGAGRYRLWNIAKLSSADETTVIPSALVG